MENIITNQSSSIAIMHHKWWKQPSILKVSTFHASQRDRLSDARQTAYSSGTSGEFRRHAASPGHPSKLTPRNEIRGFNRDVPILGLISAHSFRQRPKWLIRFICGNGHLYMDGNQKSGSNSPLEGWVVELPFFTRFIAPHPDRWLALGFLQISTVLIRGTLLSLNKNWP